MAPHNTYLFCIDAVHMSFQDTLKKMWGAWRIFDPGFEDTDSVAFVCIECFIFHSDTY